MLKPFVSLFIISMLTACAVSDLKRVAFMATSDGNKVCSGLVSAPPMGSTVSNAAVQKCNVIIPNSYTFEDLSVQPADPNASTKFALVTEFKSEKDLHNKSTSKIEIFRHGSKKADHTFENQDLKDLVSNDNIYESCFMKVLDINWVAKDKLLVDIQPSCEREHIPQEVELVINTESGRVSEGPVFMERNTPNHFNWANHYSKSLYMVSIDRSTSTVLINNAPVSGLISGVTKAEAAWVR